MGATLIFFLLSSSIMPTISSAMPGGPLAVVLSLS